MNMSNGILGEPLQKVCPAVVVGGCGYLPCTKTLIDLYICVLGQPIGAGAEAKYCTTHMFLVYMNPTFISPQKKYVILPPVQLGYISVKDRLAPERVLISCSLTKKKCQFVLFFLV